MKFIVIKMRRIQTIIVFRDMIMATLSVVQMALGNHMALLGNAGQLLIMRGGNMDTQVVR